MRLFNPKPRSVFSQRAIWPVLLFTLFAACESPQSQVTNADSCGEYLNDADDVLDDAFDAMSGCDYTRITVGPDYRGDDSELTACRRRREALRLRMGVQRRGDKLVIRGINGRQARFVDGVSNYGSRFYYLGFSDQLRHHVVWQIFCDECDAPVFFHLIAAVDPSASLTLNRNDKVRVSADSSYFVVYGNEGYDLDSNYLWSGGWNGIDLYRLEDGIATLIYRDELLEEIWDYTEDQLRNGKNYPQTWGANACWTGPRSFSFDRFIHPHYNAPLEMRRSSITIDEASLLLEEGVGISSDLGNIWGPTHWEGFKCPQPGNTDQSGTAVYSATFAPDGSLLSSRLVDGGDSPGLERQVRSVINECSVPPLHPIWDQQVDREFQITFRFPDPSDTWQEVALPNHSQ